MNATVGRRCVFLRVQAKEGKSDVSETVSVRVAKAVGAKEGTPFVDDPGLASVRSLPFSPPLISCRTTSNDVKWHFHVA